MEKQVSNNLLASISVFVEFCDSGKDLKTIINEFLKSVYVLENSQSLNSAELTIYLKKHFDFEIPEAVVRTCLHSLVKESYLKKLFGKYILINIDYDVGTFVKKLDAKKDIYDNIKNSLIKEYEGSINKNLSSDEKNKFIISFVTYLLDTNSADELSTFFSSYIMNYSNDKNFISSLNQLKEGIVIITGLKYTDDLNNIGLWSNDLTLYLDMEILFNAIGYNGELFKKIFDDFYSLINELNTYSQRKNNKKIIHLKYFTETKNEIDIFFEIASKIIKREQNAAPENIAMDAICNGCKNVSDIIKKKTEFETFLTAKGITNQEELEYSSKPQYNIEDIDLLNKYVNKVNKNDVMNILHSFTKVNYLRQGRNKTRFENSGHIIITGKNLSLFMSHDLEIKSNSKDIPFSTNIYFVTNRFWFLLNKGLSKTTNNPSSFDVITKAQVVLSSQVNKSISIKFEDLKNDVKTGKITKEEAQDFYSNLRKHARKPEEILLSNIDETIEFIYEYDLDKYNREQTILHEKVKEGEIAKNKLEEINETNLIKKEKIKKIKSYTLYYFLILLIFIIILSIPYFVFILIMNFKTSQDTNLGIIGLIFAIIVELLGLIKYLKPLNYKIRKLVKLTK